MATVLEKKPVVREVKDWKRRGMFGLGGSGGRNLILTLEPGIISFREKGLRKRYDIDIEGVFNLAVRRTNLRDEEERRRLKRERRKARDTRR